MNLDRYEKLDGFDHALRLMREGKTVEAMYKDFDGDEQLQAYKFDEEGVLVVYYNGSFNRSQLSFNKLNTRSWCIKKPFDVRRAMLDKPGEWVGIVEKPQGGHLKVGFDLKRFRAVAAYIEYGGKTYDERGTMPVDSSYLDRCEDIETWGDDL